MALVYVGGTSGVGTTATYAVSLSGTLTGGIASSPSQDDIVVVFSGFGNTAAVAPTCTGNNSGAYGFVDGTTSYHQNDTWDTEFAGRYFIQGATVDTSLTIGRAANAAYGGATVVQVWRGVDTTTPFDVAATVAGAGNASRVNPPLITPTTAGTVILAGGTGTQTTAGSAFVVSSNMAGPSVTTFGDGTTSDAGTCIASHEWTSGSFTPNVVTGGTTSTSSSWRAMTLALRAAPVVTTGDLAATDADVDTAALSGTVAWAAITGTLAATDTDVDTIAASGLVLVQGDLSATDGDTDTASLAGLVLVQGAAAATDADADTFAASGTVTDPAASGSIAATETDFDTAALTGTVLLQGVLATTEADQDAATITGVVPVQGTLDATDADTDTAALAGLVLVQGSVSVTESTQDTAEISGGSVVAVDLDVTDEADVLAAECTISDAVVDDARRSGYFDTPARRVQARLAVTDDADQLYAVAAVAQLVERIANLQAQDDADVMDAAAGMTWIQPKLIQHRAIAMIRTDRRIKTTSAATASADSRSL